MQKRARQRILEFVTQHPGASPAQIARGLGMTAPAVRHHLAILTSDGRAEKVRGAIESRRGRPPQRYRLAERLEGDNLAMVADVALTVLSAARKPGPHNRLIDAAAAALIERIGPLDSRQTASKRLTVLAERLSALHYAAHWEAGASGPKVILGRCPYAAVIRNHPELCAMDARAVAHVVGTVADQIAKMDPENPATTPCIFLLR